MKLKKNDNVKVLAGKDKGKTGRILKIDHESQRVVVQGVNMVKKTMKKRSQQDQGASRKSRHRFMSPTSPSC
jgi:large subunit ribosomal protein L24